MSARTKSRKRAVEALYAADLRDAMANDVLAEMREAALDRQNQGEIFSFAESLINGVLQNQIEIDQRIESLSQNWPMDRMPAVDRAILRLACYELMYSMETPPAVVISEALEIAKEISTDDSPGFINGVLAAIAATRKPI